MSLKTGLVFPHDIRTALTLAEAQELYELAADKVVLEVGTILGASTIVMAQSAKLVVTIDPHCGYPLPTSPPTLMPFLHNLHRYNVRKKVKPIVGRVEDCMILREENWDMIFIDNSEIAETILPAATTYAPTVALHDFGNPKGLGATIAAGRLAQPFRLVDSLAIWEER